MRFSQEVIKFRVLSRPNYQTWRPKLKQFFPSNDQSSKAVWVACQCLLGIPSALDENSKSWRIWKEQHWTSHVSKASFAILMTCDNRHLWFYQDTTHIYLYIYIIYIYIHTYTFIHDACLYIICVYHAFCWYDPKCYVITQIWGYSTATKPMFFQLQGSSPRQGKATPWAGPMVCIVQRPDLAHGPSLIVEGINHKNQGFHQWILDSTDLNEACGVYSVINR